MSAFKHFTKIDRQTCEGQCAASSDPKRRQLKLKHAWQLVLVCASTDYGRPLTSGTKLIWTVVDWIGSGRATHKRHHVKSARNLAHDFGVSLVHASVVTLAALAGEMAGVCDYLCVIKFGLNTRQ